MDLSLKYNEHIVDKKMISRKRITASYFNQSIQKTSPVYETGDVFSGFKLRQQVLFSVFFVQKTTPVVLKKTHF